MKRAVFIFVSLLLVISSCKKDKNKDATINGVVRDAESGALLSGVDISLYKQVAQTGVFSTVATFVSESTTNGGGAFSFEAEREAVQVFEFEMEKQGYFSKTEELNPDLVFNKDDHVAELTLQPRVWVSTTIVNTNGGTASDLLLFNFENIDFSCNCCTDEVVSLEGPNVDTTFLCLLPSSIDLSYRFRSFQNGIQVESDLNFVATAALDTTYIVVTY